MNTYEYSVMEVGKKNGKKRKKMKKKKNPNRFSLRPIPY